MAPARTLFTLVVALPLTVLACTSSPGGADGSGGAASTSGGGSPSSSGGTPAIGGSAAGGATTGGSNSGGSTSGGASNDGDGGLGGDAATGGGDGSGGAASDGGTGGSPLAYYAECDPDLGKEDNPACAVGEVCSGDVCGETCPTELFDAVAYDCPDPATGEAVAICAINVGQCQLVCETQDKTMLSCPTGMACEETRCKWQ
jgi:hypothetical protein